MAPFFLLVIVHALAATVWAGRGAHAGPGRVFGVVLQVLFGLFAD
jgi:hypothetical protein